MQEEKQMERRKKIAVELSELVVYCRPVPFNEDSKGARTQRPEITLQNVKYSNIPNISTSMFDLSIKFLRLNT